MTDDKPGQSALCRHCRMPLGVHDSAGNMQMVHAFAATTIALGDVIQIHPEHRLLGACLGFVTDVRSWGVLAEVPIPGRGVIPIRLGPDEYERIGHAAWEPVSAADPDGAP